MEFVELAELVERSRDDILRQSYAPHRQSMKVKKDKSIHKNLPRIMGAALKIANQKGFQAMSMRELSREAGLSRGALYAYFGGKDELLEMMQATGRDITRQVLDQAVAAAQGPLEKLRTGIRAHLFLSEAMQDWFYFSYMEAKHLGPREKELAKAGELATEKMFAELLEQGARQGVFTDQGAGLLASAIKALLQDWYVKRPKFARRQVSVEHYARFVCDLVESYCLPGAPGGA